MRLVSIRGSMGMQEKMLCASMISVHGQTWGEVRKQGGGMLSLSAVQRNKRWKKYMFVEASNKEGVVLKLDEGEGGIYQQIFKKSVCGSSLSFESYFLRREALMVIVGGYCTRRGISTGCGVIFRLLPFVLLCSSLRLLCWKT